MDNGSDRNPWQGRDPGHVASSNLTGSIAGIVFVVCTIIAIVWHFVSPFVLLKK